jgi:hypothetical protein
LAVKPIVIHALSASALVMLVCKLLGLCCIVFSQNFLI